MESDPALVLFLKRHAGGPLEAMLRTVQEAVALDLLAAAAVTGAFGRPVILTDAPDQLGPLPLDAIVETAREPFHFGSELARLVRRHRIACPIYVGGGLPLLPIADLVAIATRLRAMSGVVVTNNLFSSDLVAWAPGDAIDRIPLPDADNALAQRLRLRAGLEPVELPRTAAAQFDLDTPTDLLILKLHRGAGPRTRARLALLPLDSGRVLAAGRYLTDVQAEVLFAGRIGSWAWSQIERDSASRVRILSEERGMRADGRETSGRARSALGFLLEEVGPERFFHLIAQLGDAAFLDTRVLWAHLGASPSVEDRFRSDLLEAELIVDPAVRAFTAAARAAPRPIVLGGHSLMAGGLLALLEVVWNDSAWRVTSDG